MSSFGPAMNPSRLIIVCQSSLPTPSSLLRRGRCCCDRDHEPNSSHPIGRTPRLTSSSSLGEAYRAPAPFALSTTCAAELPLSLPLSLKGGVQVQARETAGR